MTLFGLENIYQHLELDCSEDGGSSLTKTPPTIYQSVWHHMPQVLSLHHHHTENLKSHERPVCVRNSMATHTNIPYILESNPHFFTVLEG
jgi:hypothetical protein